MRNRLDDEVDALFKLPLSDFTGARNALASQLKKSGRANDANIVKTLAKPSISAWAVNQLYWNHREAFDKLLAAGQRIRQAQTSRLAGKVAEMRGSLDARRDALSNLSDLATSLLSDAGHNPSLDTIRRITTTLEAISARASLSDGPTPGRLTYDVDPPGFESFASLFGGATPEKPAPGTASQKLRAASQKSVAATAKTLKQTSTQDRRQLEQMRRARIAEAKDALQDAKRSLTQARAKAQRLETAQKNAAAQTQEAQAKARQAEKELRQAEDRFKKESAASKDAALHAQRLAAETKEAAQTVNEANRGVEKARKELESLFQES